MRSPLFKKLPSCLLGAVIAASTAVSVPVSAVDGSPPGLFELEGNTLESGDPGDDWSLLYNNGNPPPGGSSFAFTGIVADIDPLTDTVFFQGGSKDIYDVDQWKYTLKTTPDKNDITNAYAAAYNVENDVCLSGAGVPVDCAVGQTPVHKQGDMIIYFGLDRFANDGDAFAGFWFFQGEVGQEGGDFIGNHVAMTLNTEWQQGDPIAEKYLPGDMFVIVNYPQGANASPVIKVYQWDPLDVDGDKNVDPDEIQNYDPNKPPKQIQGPLDLVTKQSDAKCDGDGGKLACAITNGEDLTGEPVWPYVSKDGDPGTLPMESFFEGGINVTRLLGSTPCFASFLAETRSSSSVTAQLKDFVFGAFPVCGIDVAKNCEAALNDSGNGVDVTFSGTLTNTGGTGYYAYLKDSVDGAVIERVCDDVDGDGCANTAGNPGVPDPNVAGFTQQDDGSVYFPLPGGAEVRYEGTYSVTGLPPIPEPTDPPTYALNDTMTALAFSEIEDIPAANQDPDMDLVVVSDSAIAGCDYQVNPDLSITKTCDLDFDAATSTATVTITGTVTNTGDVKLTNLVLTDTDFEGVTLEGGVTELEPGDSATFTKMETLTKDDLDVDVGEVVDGVKTVTLTHEDSIKVEGEVRNTSGEAFDGAEAYSTDPVSEGGSGDVTTCFAQFTNGILVEKTCAVKLDYDDTTDRIVVRVDVEATVENIGQEALDTLVLTDDPAVNFLVNGGAVPTTLAPGGSFTATGSYYPASADSGTPQTADLASFTDTVDVSANGGFSDVSASDDHEYTCDLCP